MFDDEELDALLDDDDELEEELDDDLEEELEDDFEEELEDDFEEELEDEFEEELLPDVTIDKTHGSGTRLEYNEGNASELS
jgi:hypothetical protein